MRTAQAATAEGARAAAAVNRRGVDTTHSDSGHHHHGTVMASWLLFLHPVILSVILSVMFLLYLERAGGLIYRELFRAA